MAARRGRGGRARRGGQALRGARRTILGRLSLLCRAGLCRRDTNDPTRAKFYGDVQERITSRLDPSAVLSRSSSTASMTPRWKPPCAIRRSAITGRGSRTCARRSPISSRTASSSCSTKSRSPAIRPGTGNSTRPSPALRFKIGGKELAIEPALNLLQDADGKKRKAAARGAGEDLQGQSAAVHADHQHARQGQGDFRPLARLQGRRRRAASRPTASSPKWWRRWSRPCAPPIRNCRTAITR